ncbi:AraC family transcriptional regulator, partial [Staphylococcus saprophyticus]
MDNTTLCIHEHLNTITRRCINQVILLFSLSNHLDITLNGRKISAGNNIIIINHSDLYQISNAQQVVEICIPIR